jgi:ribonucleoside-diphosphate reductase alpha chain
VAITKLASSGYLRGRTQITVVKGGAAPKMLAEEEHFRQEMFAPDNDIDHVSELDLSEIRAGVEATLTAVGAQVATIEAAMTRSSGRDSRAARALEARLKGFEGDNCGACGNFTLVRNGTCMKCNTCGSTSGCS